MMIAVLSFVSHFLAPKSLAPFCTPFKISFRYTSLTEDSTMMVLVSSSYRHCK